MIVLSFFARDLNLFTLGEEEALSLGMRVESTKRVLLAVAAAVTGVAIAVSGPIETVFTSLPKGKFRGWLFSVSLFFCRLAFLVLFSG